MIDADLLRENAELRSALAHERERSTAAMRRAELLEETARRAYRFAAVGVRPAREDPANEEG
jgi:hypothetical protein